MKINKTRDCEAYSEAAYYSDAMPAMDMGQNMNNMGYGYGMGEQNMGMMGEAIPGCVCPPVYEAPRETVCHRYICHEVPHIQPCNTRIINHHIYRHTFTPTYSCCEENEVQNVYENNRCC